MSDDESKFLYPFWKLSCQALQVKKKKKKDHLFDTLGEEKWNKASPELLKNKHIKQERGNIC